MDGIASVDQRVVQEVLFQIRKNRTFNASIDTVVKWYQEKGVKQYFFTNKLLIKLMEMKGKVEFAEAHPVSYVWIGWNMAAVDRDEYEEH